MARTQKTGRNDLCPCGSGKKVKRCCEAKTATTTWSTRVMVALVVAVLAGAVYLSIGSFGEPAPAGAGRVWSPEHGHYH